MLCAKFRSTHSRDKTCTISSSKESAATKNLEMELLQHKMVCVVVLKSADCVVVVG